MIPEGILVEIVETPHRGLKVDVEVGSCIGSTRFEKRPGDAQPTVVRITENTNHNQSEYANEIFLLHGTEMI